MVNVGSKTPSLRTAVAACRVVMSPRLHSLLVAGGGHLAKGSVLTTAELAGVMGAKQTPCLIPLCHQLALNSVTVSARLHPTQPQVEVTCSAECHGRTGVEMEALTGCSVAALTVYDMCKAVDKAMAVTDLRLLAKTGGKSPDYVYDKDAATTDEAD